MTGLWRSSQPSGTFGSASHGRLQQETWHESPTRLTWRWIEPSEDRIANVKWDVDLTIDPGGWDTLEEMQYPFGYLRTSKACQARWKQTISWCFLKSMKKPRPPHSRRSILYKVPRKFGGSAPNPKLSYGTSKPSTT